MSNQQEFEQKQAAMLNMELIAMAQKEIGLLASSGGKTFKMSIPPQIHDSDMLLSELVKRFERWCNTPMPQLFTRKILAETIVNKLFAHKTDLGGKPYIEHLYRVANSIPDYLPNHETLYIVALLHDVIEDCPDWNESVLTTLFGAEISHAVAALTKPSMANYSNYITDQVLANKLAVIVKRFDLEDNMNLTRLPAEHFDYTRLKKYHEAYQLILCRYQEIMAEYNAAAVPTGDSNENIAQ